LDGPETPSASEEVDYLEEIEDEPVQVVAESVMINKY